MNSACSDTVSAAQAIVASLIEHGINVVFEPRLTWGSAASGV
jgi:hypothetical protein